MTTITKNNIENIARVENDYAIIEKNEEVSVCSWAIHSLSSLTELENLQKETRKKIVFITPFCLVQNEKWYDAIWDEPILAMEIESEILTNREELLELMPNDEVRLWAIQKDINDEDFSETVSLAKEEIHNWNVNQVVLSRKFMTNIDISSETILNIYSKLLQNRWQYMTFLFNTPDKTFIWASPEKHLEARNNQLYMNPIAWTFWKKDEETFLERFLEFLEDDKEIWELAMVIDEELKMIAKITKSWIIDWPLLKEVWAVIHTEANLKWEKKENLSIIEAFRETLYAPTLVWWPLESAFSTIKKYENESREYYWWAFWVLWDGFIDSAIVIRTAFIDKLNSILSVRAWAWIVKDSEPKKETEETTLKSNWFFGSLKWKNSPNAKWYLQNLSPEKTKKIEELLEQRKSKLSKFYLESNLEDNLEVKEISWKKIVILHSGDDFTELTWFMLKKMWANVEIINSLDFDTKKSSNYDIVLLWPGYWDINDENDEKMVELLKTTEELIKKDTKLVWICLWHQAICKNKWYKIERQNKITQWEQLEVTLDWQKENLGFYNSFSPVANINSTSIQRFEWNRILKLTEKNISSSQFHPESIMSINGFEVLKKMILELL